MKDSLIIILSVIGIIAALILGYMLVKKIVLDILEIMFIIIFGGLI